MSVEVKTPTKAQYDHPWQEKNESTDARKAEPSVSGGRGGRSGAGRGNQCHGRERAQSVSTGAGRGTRPSSAPGRIGRKRRSSERAPDHNHPFKKRFRSHFRHEKIVLPTKFLLGGNISDPLNLNSLNDEDINRALNEKTPVHSPLPIPPHKGEVKVLIPPNIYDPLGLDQEINPSLISPNKIPEKKRKHKRKNNANLAISPIIHPDEVHNKEQASTSALATAGTSGNKRHTQPMRIYVDATISTKTQSKLSATAKAVSHHRDSSSDALSSKLERKILNKIVSPVIPQTSPKKRKRRSSDGPGSSDGVNRAIIKDDKTSPNRPKPKPDKLSPHRPKYRKQSSNQSSAVNLNSNKASRQKQDQFIYGNYNRYYGYRNPNHEDDDRLQVMKREWFENKDILDIGCNTGHITLHVAKHFKPHNIIGMDIDGKLIGMAKRNIRNYLLPKKKADRFPVSMESVYGPVSAPEIPETSSNVAFPHNVNFLTGNFVPEKDELLELQKEEYDVVLALSITKWMHLHNGDMGLKRAFKRMFRALKPGGKLILEPQAWASYKRKKKLTEKIAENYKKIRFRPDQFTEYLLSREVGFSKCESLHTPFNKSKGFQRPLQVFTKPETAQVTPLWSWNNTPSGTGRESGANTPWWESIEAQVAGSPLMDTHTVSPSVTMSPMITSDAYDTVTTSGISSPLQGSLIGLDSANTTPVKVKFAIGSSGFCSPCDSASASPRTPLMHTHTSTPPKVSSSHQDNAEPTAADTSLNSEHSAISLLSVTSSTAMLNQIGTAPGRLETAEFRLREARIAPRSYQPQLSNVETAPGLLETYSSSCSDSEGLADSSQESCVAYKAAADGVQENEAVQSHTVTRNSCDQTLTNGDVAHAQHVSSIEASSDSSPIEAAVSSNDSCVSPLGEVDSRLSPISEGEEASSSNEAAPCDSSNVTAGEVSRVSPVQVSSSSDVTSTAGALHHDEVVDNTEEQCDSQSNQQL